ncbi:MAG: hypothetical protein HFG76_02570 [Hungatella sp.]|nr:hypothetical protein [Hungatella sp.]
MSIMMVTSLNTYTKNMEMKMKWQKKQVEKDYTAHETTSADSAVQKQLEDIRESQKDGSAQMAAQIDLKMMSGKRLSAQEMEYLKEHDPETYKKAKAIEMEREAYERELKNCKTKEEVQRVKAAHAAAGLDQVNNIKNNPNIPSGKKLALIKQELAKSTALEDSMRSFVKSGDYKKLPTEAERQKAEKEMEEAKKAEMGLDEETKDKVEDDSNQEEVPDPADPDSQEPDGDPAVKDPELLGDGDTNAPVSDTQVKEARKTVAERVKTRAQAEVTPEARKVRQARARAAYAAHQFHITETQTPKIDIKR